MAILVKIMARSLIKVAFEVQHFYLKAVLCFIFFLNFSFLFSFKILKCSKYDLLESSFTFLNVELIPSVEKCGLPKPGKFLQMMLPGFASLQYFICRKRI